MYPSKTSNDADESEPNVVPPEIPKINIYKKSKKTISYSQQKNYEDSTPDPKTTHPAFRERQKKFSIHVTI